ncbi:MAG: hypothetical protein ACHQUC_02630 [Chlamydiales bacterium]
MLKFFTFFAFIVLFTGSLLGYNSERDMINKTKQLTIAKVASFNGDQALVVMTDGSLWKIQRSGYPRIDVGETAYIENYHEQVVGRSYPWVYGYEQGFDMNWTEIRKSARLLFIDGAASMEEIPYSPYKANFTIIDIVQDGDSEILLLENSSMVVMPSQHGGNTVGDQVVIQVMKNGTSAYLTRQLSEEGETVLIPMHRSSSHVFNAH